MNWEGQKLAEQLMQYLFLASALISFFTGYFFTSFRLMLLIYASGALLTTLITVPDWPFYNRRPLQWLDPKAAEASSSRIIKAAKVQAPKKASKSVKK
ncbi:hypothetical protein O6H91_07G071000 [Diphasiastrum complanatum]|uniref:Uncharacterized protein n=1 Tax=Diphasiastrum complanatum TaxID=34168 RepID=A0ACC2D691_DIPCM|nr:hypothetical protein O6H91_07G071000 [Diphasiastrum complanatum]